VRRVALLGTPATLELGIYGEPLAARGIEVRLPTAAQQAAVDRAIAHVKANRMRDARTEFEPVAHAMLDGGADVIVLACTELPLIERSARLRAATVDPTDALARAIVRHALAPCPAPTRHVS
jgi:aspartate racemase